MEIEEALTAHLKNNSGVAAVLGARIYPVEVPEGQAAPAAVYRRLDTVRVRSKDGPAGWSASRFRIGAFGPSYMGCKAAATAIRKACDGYSGTMGGAGGVLVSQATVEADSDPTYDLEAKEYGALIEIELWHDET